MLRDIVAPHEGGGVFGFGQVDGVRAVREEKFVRLAEAGGDAPDLVSVHGAVGCEAVEAEDAEFICHADFSVSVYFTFQMKFEMRQSMRLRQSIGYKRKEARDL